MTKLIINNCTGSVKIKIKNKYDKFPYEFTLAVIDLLKNGVLTQFEKEVLAMLVRMNDKQLEDTRIKLSTLLYDTEVHGHD